jgi:sugar lactone lactonase YvrE
MNESPMYRSGRLERSITELMADEAAASSDALVLDQTLTATSRLRPDPRWLALLKEPPMTVQAQVLVGTPSRRPILIVALIVLLALAAGVAVAGSHVVNLYTRPTSTFIWRATAPGLGFSAPSGIVLDSKGNIWAPDTEHDRFAIFRNDGTFLETWGGPGSGQGQFSLRRANGDGYGAVAFQADGSFYVLDVGNYRVEQFDAARKFVRAWGSVGTGPVQYSDPTGIAIGPDGSVYVLDDVRQVVEHLTREGVLIADIAVLGDTTPGVSTNALTVDQNGNMYISRADQPWRVQKLDPTGRLLTTYGAAGSGRFTAQANQVAFDPHGHVLVTQGPGIPAGESAVLVYNADGTFFTGLGVAGAGENQIQLPTGLILDSNRNHFVEDPMAGNTITKYELGRPLYP